MNHSIRPHRTIFVLTQNLARDICMPFCNIASRDRHLILLLFIVNIEVMTTTYIMLCPWTYIDSMKSKSKALNFIVIKYLSKTISVISIINFMFQSYCSVVTEFCYCKKKFEGLIDTNVLKIFLFSQKFKQFEFLRKVKCYSNPPFNFWTTYLTKCQGWSKVKALFSSLFIFIFFIYV